MLVVFKVKDPAVFSSPMSGKTSASLNVASVSGNNIEN